MPDEQPKKHIETGPIIKRDGPHRIETGTVIKRETPKPPPKKA
jgi:hypothetical protein